MRIHIGQRYRVENFGDYILAQVLPKQVCLVDLEDGNRFVDPVKVKDVFGITSEEFDLITNCDEKLIYKLIEK